MAISVPAAPWLASLNPYLTWPLLIVILSALAFVSYAFYNLVFHPLQNVPGPKLWAATQIPYTLAWLSGRLSFVIHDLHEKHGDVVRVAPNRLSFTHPDAWHDVRGHRKSGQAENPKDMSVYWLSADNILGASRDAHSRFRRVLSHGFSAKSMQAQQPLITQYVDLLMQRLRERTHGDGEKGQPREVVIDLAAWFNFTTFDVIGDLAFGAPFGCLERSTFHPWVYEILQGVKSFAPFAALNWYFGSVTRPLKDVLPWRRLRSPLDKQVDLAREQVEKRLSLEGSRPDFIETMATAEDDAGQKMTRRELISNARLLVVAGSETTATALTGAAYFLATHPEKQRKLAEEVRTTFASEAEIDLFSVNHLSYMLALLDESMRLYPPVPSHLPRVCQPGGSVFCGYHVPGGTGLDIWPWAMFHSSRNFTAPEEFIPERWLEDEYDGHRFDKSRHNALQPFSLGPRNCIGKNLAYVEMRLILARLIFKYDMSIADRDTEQFLRGKAFTLWVKKPLNIRLVPVAEK